ncbi:MAG: DUF3683 domain-containing protein, partial [Thiotrichaceae bacterium]|nr:DUF3683 domain-containing protein [Thiotrichaceae bacterium]
MKAPYREIPYNYTSFSDREIILRVLGERAWEILETLREKRATGLSAHMLLEVLGDIWVVMRNPYIQDDLLENEKRRYSLMQTMRERLDRIKERADGNALTLELVEIGQRSVDDFATWFSDYYALRKKAIRKFRHITQKDNIQFDGLARVSHVTDATDWRVELPFVVLTPDTEAEIAELVQTCIKLGLTVIPRGGGTGYTGGAIPLDAMSAVINTEKLETLGAIQKRTDLHGVDSEVAVIRADA